MKFRIAAWLCILSFSAVALSGCSLFKKSRSSSAEDEAAMADAETDAIPEASSEMPYPDEIPAPDAPPPVDTAEAPAPAPEMEPAPAPDAAPEAAPPIASLDPAPEVAPPPVADPAPAAAPEVASSGEMESYTVRSGETLMMIAFEAYGDLYKWKDIYEANKALITDPNAIPAGTVLKFEKGGGVMIERNGEKYLIKRGDTLGTISGEVYGTTSKWRKLWENNRQLIKDPNRIFAGFYLYYVPESNNMAPADQRLPASAPATDAPPEAPAPGA